MLAKQRNEAIRHVIAYVFTIVMVFLAVTPFIYVVLTALKTKEQIYDPSQIIQSEEYRSAGKFRLHISLQDTEISRYFPVLLQNLQLPAHNQSFRKSFLCYGYVQNCFLFSLYTSPRYKNLPQDFSHGRSASFLLILQYQKDAGMSKINNNYRLNCNIFVTVHTPLSQYIFQVQSFCTHCSMI